MSDELITQTEFAKRMKFAKGLIATYKKDGVLKMRAGRVRWEASKLAVQKHRAKQNPARTAAQALRHADARQRAGHKHDYLPKGKGKQASTKSDPAELESAEFVARIGKAKGDRSITEAAHARMRFEKEAGKLVALDDVNRAAAEAGRMVRDMLLLMTPELAQKITRECLVMLPEEWSAKISGMLDHKRIAALLTAEYRSLLATIAQLAAEPMAQRMTQ